MISDRKHRFLYLNLNEDGVSNDTALLYDDSIDQAIENTEDLNFANGLSSAMSRPDFPPHLIPATAAILVIFTPGASAQDIVESFQPLLANMNPVTIAQVAGSGTLDWLIDGVGVFQEALDYLSETFGWDTKSLSEKIKSVLGGLAVLGAIEEYIRRTHNRLVRTGKKEVYGKRVNLGHIPAHPTTMSLENGKLTFILDTSSAGKEVLIEEVLKSMSAADVKAIRSAIRAKYKGEIKGKKEIDDYDIFLNLPSDVLGRFLSTLEQLTTDLTAVRQSLTSGESRERNNGNGIVIIPVIEPGIKKNYTENGIEPQLVGTSDKEFNTKIKLRRIEVSERVLRDFIKLFSSYYWHEGAAVPKSEMVDAPMQPQTTFFDALAANDKDALAYLFGKQFAPIQEIDFPREYIDQARFVAVLKGGVELLKHDRYEQEGKQLDAAYSMIAKADIGAKEKLEQLREARKNIAEFKKAKSKDPVRVGVANANPRPDGTAVNLDVDLKSSTTVINT